MTLQSYLGVDLGLESGRVIAGQFDGKNILQCPAPVSQWAGQTRKFARWNVLGLWSEIQNGLRQAASEYGQNVVSVGVDTWGSTMSYSPETRKSLANLIITGMLEIMGDAGRFLKSSRTEIYAQTGLQFMEFNTLYQLIAFQQAEPGLMKQASHFLDDARLSALLLMAVKSSNSPMRRQLNATMPPAKTGQIVC
ncbi:MAG: hypothetical protein R3C11_07355 [Planctomycetaceae bacterium]